MEFCTPPLPPLPPLRYQFFGFWVAWGEGREGETRSSSHTPKTPEGVCGYDIHVCQLLWANLPILNRNGAAGAFVGYFRLPG